MHKQVPPNRLSELRQAQKLTLQQVGQVAGKHYTTVVRYENGEVPIPDDVKAKLALRFGVSRAYLMGWDEGQVAA